MADKIDNIRHILLTGLPGRGKTTVIIKLCELLSNIKIPVIGFYTKELRSGDSRCGFDIFTLDGHQGPLARLATADGGPRPFSPKVGRYEVDQQSFESLVLPLFTDLSNTSVMIIDEIGKMELFSKKFERAVTEVFKKDIIVVATVPSKGRHPVVDHVLRLPTTKLIEVDYKNRNNLPTNIAEIVRNTHEAN